MSKKSLVSKVVRKSAAEIPPASRTDLDRLRALLTGLSQYESGLHVLAAAGYKGFVAPNPEVEQRAIAWLGE